MSTTLAQPQTPKAPSIARDPHAMAPPADMEQEALDTVLEANSLDGAGSVTQQVHRLLHTLIVNLRLLPNQLLPVNEVARCLDISKTPVREAFIRLEEEGLVNIVPKKGTFVAPIDIQRAFEGYFIRISMESACVASLARKGSPEALAVLREELDLQRKSLDEKNFDLFYLLDNRFHAVMFDVAGFGRTRRLLDSAKAEVDRIKGLKSVYRICRPEDVLLREHEDMFDAVCRGNVRRAREEVRKHLTGMQEAIQAMAKEEKLWGMVKTINQGAGRQPK